MNVERVLATSAALTPTSLTDAMVIGAITRLLLRCKLCDRGMIVAELDADDWTLTDTAYRPTDAQIGVWASRWLDEYHRPGFRRAIDDILDQHKGD